MSRSFLFLQGPHGPFLRQLGRRLEQEGRKVLRVNLTGGDWIDWRGRDTVAWRGWPDDFAGWIVALAQRATVSDLVLYGDCRPLHRAAIAALALRGIRVHVLEEVYVRPDWVTLERDGVNAFTRLRRDPVSVLVDSGRLEHRLPGGAPTGAGTHWMVLWCLRHHLAALLARPFFRHYRGHRPVSIGAEILGWARRLLSLPWRRRGARREIAALERSPAPVFLLTLQLDADSQIRHRSPSPAWPG
jgi:capsular polysaccharide export protein